ncbi:MAG: hypothetical protein K0U74_08630 [Alphaproteobacteria bacterium]|nr:hypothetical protein [Alphaproteobacteria bacterium]
MKYLTATKLIIAATAGLLFLGTAAAVYKYRWPIYMAGLKHFVYPPMGPSQLGDGRKATKITLFHPGGMIKDPDGNIFIADRGESRNGRPFQGSLIWRIDPEGNAAIIAGTGEKKKLPGNIRALDADLRSVERMQFDDQGRLIFIDHKYGIICRLEADGRLTRIAGTGRRGYSGDGGPALKATFNKPYDIARDDDGNLFVADAENHVIRRITPDGKIDTYAGVGTPGYSGDGGPARNAQLNKPYNIAFDTEGRLLIGDSENHVVRRVDKAGVISTIAGSGSPGYEGDGGPALSAKLDAPQAIQVFGKRIYIGDEHNHAIRMVDENGIITTLIGTGKPGFAPDGSAAIGSPLHDPEGFWVNEDGRMYVLDSFNHRVLLIDKQGRISTFAGRGLDTRKLVRGEPKDKR